MATQKLFGLMVIVLCVGLVSAMSVKLAADDATKDRYAEKAAEVAGAAYNKAKIAAERPVGTVSKEEVQKLSREWLMAKLRASNSRTTSIEACSEYLEREGITVGKTQAN